MQFDDPKFRTLSEIARDTAQVFFASMFVGPLISGGQINWPVIISGSLLTLIFWALSLSLAK